MPDPMRHSTLLFIGAAYALLTLSRLALSAWQWRRVKKAGGLRPILLGGLRIDTHQIAVLAALPAVLSTWVGHLPQGAVATSIWLQVCCVLLGLLEFDNPACIN